MQGNLKLRQIWDVLPEPRRVFVKEHRQIGTCPITEKARLS